MSEIAACAKCKRNISSLDAKKAVVQRDEQGRIVGMLHFKCSQIIKKHTRMGEAGSREKQRYKEESPSVYEEALRYENADDLTPEAIERKRRQEEELVVLKARQDDIATQRALEPKEEHFADWRDPAEVDIDDLTQSSGETVSVDEVL